MPRIANRKHPNTPENLAAKLLEIRIQLKESQNGMLARLGLTTEFERDYVSKWERGLLKPPLFVLCAYADAANVWLEVLAKDDLVLPDKLPAKVKVLASKNVES